jgi:hypothetical protein
MSQLTNRMSIAYWQKDGLEIYHLVDGKPVKYAAGTPDKIKPLREYFGKKVLIVGKDLLLHQRKKYPPAPEEKIMKAVALEIGEIFPLQKPAFQCRIFKSFSSYSIVDIWAWESDQYDRIREIFPFGFVIPEDLLYAVAEPEIKIFRYRGMAHMLAHADGKFLAGASYPEASFSLEDAQRFINSLEQFDLQLRRVVIFGKLPFSSEKIIPTDLVGVNRPMVVNAPEGNYPACLDYIAGADLRTFKVSDVYRLWEKKDLFLRIAIYILLGYTAFLYLTLRNYDRSIDEIGKKMSVLNNTSREASRSGDDYSDVYNEINKKLAASPTPLKIMNTLAQNLPQGSFINRMVLSENHIDISVSSKEPLVVFKMLGNAPGISKVSIKGAPVRNRNTSLYEFNMTIELAP